MAEKEYGFMDAVKDGLENISKILLSSIFPQGNTESIIKNVENRIMKMEQRMLKKMWTMFMIGLGLVFLIFSFFFLLIEYFGLSRSLSFLIIGMVIFVAGLLLKVWESDG
jgi:hypothetical protein